MRTYIGIDGIPGAWVAVYVTGEQQYFDYGHLDRLLATSYERAMIDVPIGLPVRGYRACDIEAREYIKSRVFLGARWDVWTFQRYKDANDHYWSVDDKGISKQLWAIRDKLKEVNEFMTAERQSRLLEAHPELVFWRLSGRKQIENKKTDAGRRKRIELLEQQGFRRIKAWLGQRWGTGIGRDDLIDACACALAARESDDRLPDGDPPTARGIRMEMWY